MLNKEPLLTSEDVRQILPHRFPFLLVDRVLEFHEGPTPNSRVGRKAVALKNVTINEPFFTGHFPHKAIMPGVLIIEAMAQCGALACFRKTDPEMDVAIAFVKDAKFRKPVVPGDTLILKTEIVKDRGQMILLQCEAHVEGQKVAEAEILASVTLKVVAH